MAMPLKADFSLIHAGQKNNKEKTNITNTEGNVWF